MNFGRAETARPAHHHTAILFVPLKHRARTYAEFLADFCRDGDLALCRDF